MKKRKGAACSLGKLGMLGTLAMASIAVTAACGSNDAHRSSVKPTAQEPAPPVGAHHADVNPSGKTCAGSCTLTQVTRNYGWGDYSFETYNCTGFSQQAWDGASTTDCAYVARCFADGMCSGTPVVAYSSGLGSRTFGNCNKDKTFCEAAGVELKPVGWGLYPSEPEPKDQDPAGYLVPDATNKIDVDKRNPCREDNFHWTGSGVCDPDNPGSVKMKLQTNVDHCFTDPNSLPPARWLHLNGGYPSNNPDGQEHIEVDKFACAAGIGGGAYEGSSGGPWGAVWGGIKGAKACVPKFTDPKTLDSWTLGADFDRPSHSVPMDRPFTLDATGLACQRTWNLKWMNARNARILEPKTINTDTGNLNPPFTVADSDGAALFDSGGAVVAKWSEDCRCRYPWNDATDIGFNCPADGSMQVFGSYKWSETLDSSDTACATSSGPPSGSSSGPPSGSPSGPPPGGSSSGPPPM